jgi:hypothetical protein
MRLFVKIILYGIAIALLVNTAMLVTTKQVVSYVVFQPETAQEIYYESVPYMENEEYIEMAQFDAKDCRNEYIPYDVKNWTGRYECVEMGDCVEFDLVCKDWASPDNCRRYEKVCKRSSCSSRRVICSLTVWNKYQEGGPFTVKMYARDGSKILADEPLTQVIPAGGIEKWDFVYDLPQVNASITCDYNISKVPTYQTCSVHKVEKPVKKVRQVMKYRNVSKNRTVTVQKPILQEKEVYRYLT